MKRNLAPRLTLNNKAPICVTHSLLAIAFMRFMILPDFSTLHVDELGFQFFFLHVHLGLRVLLKQLAYFPKTDLALSFTQQFNFMVLQNESVENDRFF